MITVILQGGMGNQMFQYAFGLAQARRLGVGLILDTRWLLKGHRKYELHQWAGIHENTVAGIRSATIVENVMSYNQDMIDSIKDGGVISGYFQTEKYFSSIGIELRRIIFSPKQINDETALRVLRSPNSVAIHVRRGDYLKSPHKEFHGVMSKEYYQAAVAEISSRIENPNFFIFSDDPDWCRENLQGEVLQTGSESQDLHLMSCCEHAIIANSSFGWWGAYLGEPRPGRTVIAPEKWFDQAEEDYCDIVPESWIKL